jgi:type I restriction enzyme S subunit
MSALSMKPGWKMVKFGDVVKNANLVERDLEAAGIERIVGLEHLDPENLHIRRWNSPENGTSFSRKFVSGQTLFGKRRAYQRKVAFAEFGGICSGDILTFEPKDKKALLPELLPFICQSDAFFDHALGTSAGSLSPRTSWKALKGFEFPLPPIKEQKRIAEILWAADETVETYRESLNAVELAFAKVIGNRLPKRNDPSAKFIQLSKLCKTQPQSGIYKSEDFQGSGVKIVKMGTLFGNEVVTDEIEMDLIELNEKEKERFTLTSNDLLFGRRSIVLEGAGKCSRVGHLDEPLAFESSILRVTIDDTRANPAFIYTWLNSPEGKKELRRIRSFTTVAGITGTDLKKVKIPNIDIEHQEEIVSFYFSNRRKADSISVHIESLEATKKTLANNLMCEVAHV